MKTRRSLEKASRILGMPFKEAFVYIATVMIILVAKMLLSNYIRFPSIVNYALPALLIGIYGVLRWADHKGTPSFLLSSISWLLIQPRRIQMKQPHLTQHVLGKHTRSRFQ